MSRASAIMSPSRAILIGSALTMETVWNPLAGSTTCQLVCGTTRTKYVPGGNIWYRVVGGGPATPLILLHGGPGVSSIYLKPMEALAAGTRHFDRLLVAKGLRSRRLSEAIRRATHLGIPLRFEMRETLDRMAGGVPHQGVIAIVSEKPVLSLEALLADVHDPALLVVLDCVEDPRNLGAVLRTAEAAGADGVLLPERHSAGLSETVARASAGALEHVRVARVGNLVQALEQLKQRGVWVIGFDAAGTERWDAVDLARLQERTGGKSPRAVREHAHTKPLSLILLQGFDSTVLDGDPLGEPRHHANIGIRSPALLGKVTGSVGQILHSVPRLGLVL